MAVKSSNKSVSRTRNYATVVYPDSVNENWESILASSHIATFISPLHDKDKNPTGENKKPHYHVLIMFDSVKTQEQAKEVFNSINGVGCEPVKSIRGYARYLCHLDNPEKAQYNPDDVKSLCGADYHSVIGLAIDRLKAIDEMMDFVDEVDIKSFYVLSKYARIYRSDWSRVLKESGTVFMREFIKSRVWSIENDEIHIVDPETGEKLF